MSLDGDPREAEAPRGGRGDEGETEGRAEHDGARGDEPASPPPAAAGAIAAGVDAASAPRAGRDLVFTAALFVLALLPRLYVAIAWAREPVWDGHYYDFGARRIAAGLGYSDDLTIAGQKVWHPWCHYPVGYSAFLGGLYRVFGGGPHVATIANAVAGAALVAAVHRLARYATTPARARIAGLLAALAPGLVIYAALLMTEPLAALGLVLTAWAFVRDAKARPVRGALIAGLLLGLTALVRPQSLAVAPALGLMLPWDGAATWNERLRRACTVAAVSLAVALAVVAPWTVRNCRVMDGCALVSTNGGWNLAIGAFPRATGRFETLRATDGCPVVTGQVQQDRCWLDEGVRWIRRDPIRWLGLVPKKLGFTFDHESFPIGYLGEADPAAWPEARKEAGREWLTLAHRLLLTAAALALAAWPLRAAGRARIVQLGVIAGIAALALRGFMNDEHPFWPIAVAIPVLALLPLSGAPRRSGVIGYLAFLTASVVATHAVFFGEDRYHMVVTPALCILAACALREPRVAAPSKMPRAVQPVH